MTLAERIAAAQQEHRAIEQQMSAYQQELARLEQQRLMTIGRLNVLIELDTEQREQDRLQSEKLLADAEQAEKHRLALLAQEQQAISNAERGADDEKSHTTIIAPGEDRELVQHTAARDRPEWRAE